MESDDQRSEQRPDTSYSLVSAERRHMAQPSKPSESKTTTWMPFVLWSIPIIFGAGASVASVTTVAKQVDAVQTKLDAHLSAHPDADRRALATESRTAQCERSTDALHVELRTLQDRVTRLEQNVVALCATQRSAQCVR